MSGPGQAGDAPRVVLVPWGLFLEDWLDLAGLTLERFCDDFDGSWTFDTVRALQAAGTQCDLLVVSRSVRHVELRTHRRSGARLWLVPPPPLARWARTRRPGRWPASLPGPVRGLRGAATTAWLDLVAYRTTPVLALARLARRAGWEAVLVQEYEFPRFDVLVGLGRVLRLPVVGIFQGGDYQRWWTEHLVRRWAVRGAAGLVVGSGAERQRLQERYQVPPERLHALGNPVDADLWSPGTAAQRAGDRVALGVQDGERLVVWHGRVEVDKKGLDTLLEAWPLVHAAQPRARLLLVGGGADDARLAGLLEACPPAARQCIRWQRGLVDDKAALARTVAAGDLYVLPSRGEGYPVALVEASACGVPAVATRVHGTREILGPDAGLVEPGDPQGLAAALVAALDDHDLPERGAAARARVLDTATPGAVGARLTEVLLGARG